MKKKDKIQQQIVFPAAYSVLAADLSLKRPGFCLIVVRHGRIVEVKTYSLDNKTKVKPRGKILEQIMAFTEALMRDVNVDPCIFVRQKAVNSFGGNDSMSSKTAVAAVVGVTDLVLWHLFKKEWHEIYPITVKKLITGNARADKQTVADSLTQYIGKHTYACDDESDAAAVGLAWLIQQKQIQQIVEEKNHEENQQSVSTP